MATFFERTPVLGVGDDVKFYDDGKDGHPEKWANGIVKEVGDEAFTVQWEDLPDPTEYEFCKVEIQGNQIFEKGSRIKNEFKALESFKNDFNEMFP